MSGDTTIQIQSLLDALKRGDPDARAALTARAVDRLRTLAGSVIRYSFPEFRDRVEPDQVLGDLWLRLDQALAAVQPTTPADFFALASKKSREVLLDLVRRERKRWEREAPLPSNSSDLEAAGALSQETHDPARLEIWDEFHRLVESLQGAERQVFDMHWYGDITQAEIAAELGLTPKQVSRLWLAATERIADGLPGFQLS